MNDFFGLSGTKTLDVIVILLIGVLLYIAGGRLLGWLIGRMFTHAYEKTMHPKDLEKRRNTLRALFVMIWRVTVVLGTGIVVARQFVSAEALTPLFASAGILGVALGFGTQSMVRDFITGIFILSENQFRVGDVIEINGFSGTVERIGARSTVLRDVDGNVHYFPNGIIDHVINKTMDYSKARVIMSVAPNTDIDQAIAIINQIGSDLAEEDEWKPKIIDAPAYVMFGNVSATSVQLIVSGKVPPSDQWSVSAELRRRILEAFEAHGIELGLETSGSAVVPTAKQSHKKR